LNIEQAFVTSTQQEGKASVTTVHPVFCNRIYLYIFLNARTTTPYDIFGKDNDNDDNILPPDQFITVSSTRAMSEQSHPTVSSGPLRSLVPQSASIAVISHTTKARVITVCILRLLKR